MINDELIQRIVREVVREVEQQKVTAVSFTPPAPGARIRCTPDQREIHSVDSAEDPAMLEKLVALTSSRIAVGRAGLRMKTDLALLIREGHADAKDAVHSEVPDAFVLAQGWKPLITRCKDRHEYLLHPNLGRRLSDDSAKQIEATAPDVQVIVGDGLSPAAIVKNGVQATAALLSALAAAGYKTGPVLYTKFTRIGVQDEIGVLSKARATVILVGERPGLGTGDSLSFYIAVKPRLDQDNAEKNCISNVRPIGIRPEEAAKLTIEILKRSFQLGGGGVAIGFGFGRQ
jgi:ethanolamine ammonia-lyase small subunit